MCQWSEGLPTGRRAAEGNSIAAARGYQRREIPVQYCRQGRVLLGCAAKLSGSYLWEDNDGILCGLWRSGG
jgi:hypothetical protein